MDKISNTHKPQGSYQEDRSQTAGLGVSHTEEEDKKRKFKQTWSLPPHPRSPQPSTPGPASATSLPAGLRGGSGPQALRLSHRPESSSSPGRAPHPDAATPRPSPPSHHHRSRRRASGALKKRRRKGRSRSRKSRAAVGRGQWRGRAEPPGEHLKAQAPSPPTP